MTDCDGNAILCVAKDAVRKTMADTKRTPQEVATLGGFFVLTVPCGAGQATCKGSSPKTDTKNAVSNSMAGHPLSVARLGGVALIFYRIRWLVARGVSASGVSI